MLWCIHGMYFPSFLVLACSPCCPPPVIPLLHSGSGDTSWSSSLQHCALLQFRHGRLPPVLPQRKRGRVPLSPFLRCAPPLSCLYYSAAYGYNVSACVFQYGRKCFEDGHACWNCAAGVRGALCLSGLFFCAPKVQAQITAETYEHIT